MPQIALETKHFGQKKEVPVNLTSRKAVDNLDWEKLDKMTWNNKNYPIKFD